MTVNDEKVEAEGIGTFLDNVGNVSNEAGEKIVINVFKNPRRAMEKGRKLVVPQEAEFLKRFPSTRPDVVFFSHTCERLIPEDLYSKQKEKMNLDS